MFFAPDGTHMAAFSVLCVVTLRTLCPVSLTILDCFLWVLRVALLCRLLLVLRIGKDHCVAKRAERSTCVFTVKSHTQTFRGGCFDSTPCLHGRPLDGLRFMLILLPRWETKELRIISS